jgi:hypothetical protein
MMHEFISPKGRYHPDNSHMADNAALCNWTGESQDKLRIVHKHFEHNLGVRTSVMVIYTLVCELLSLSYFYTFVSCLMKCVSCLMKCVPQYDLD